MNDNDQRALCVHKISQVEFLAFRARYPRLHGKNARKTYHGFGGEVTIARLTTNQGAMGWAALSGPLVAARAAKERLLGKPLSEVFDPAIGILSEEYSPFDLPLHDLAGQILRIPVSKMISASAVDKVAVYDGAIYMNDLIPEDSPFGIDAVLRDCADDIALGHRTLKIKIGRGYQWMEHDAGLARDIELVNRIHAAYPDITLMVDANDGYTVQDAIDFLEGIKNVKLYWFEEPFREEEGNNRALREYLDLHRPQTLIADGESMTEIPLLLSLADKKLVNVLQPDVCGYGFTPWRKLMKELAAHGFLGSPHAWGDVVKTHYCAHLAAAYPQLIPCIEAVLGTSEGVDHSGYTLSNGIMTVPDKPGFGMDLIWAPALEG